MPSVPNPSISISSSREFRIRVPFFCRSILVGEPSPKTVDQRALLGDLVLLVCPKGTAAFFVLSPGQGFTPVRWLVAWLLPKPAQDLENQNVAPTSPSPRPGPPL